MARRARRRSPPPRRPRLDHWRSDGEPKVRYANEAEANRAGLYVRLEHGTDQLAYQCEFCGGWHLGASERRG